MTVTRLGAIALDFLGSTFTRRVLGSSLVSRAERRRGGSRPVVAQVVLQLATVRPVEFVDLTDAIAGAVADAGLWTGVASVQTQHTTTGLLVNEHERRLLEDFVALFERLAPTAGPYAHDDFSRRTGPLAVDERTNGAAHCRAALLRATETIHVSAGALALGRWQRVLFVDFDGGQRRQVSLLLSGVSPAIRG